MHLNNVRILVYDQNDQPIQLYRPDEYSEWKIDFGTAIVSEGKEDKNNPYPFWDLSHTSDANLIVIGFNADRHRTEPVAVSSSMPAMARSSTDGPVRTSL